MKKITPAQFWNRLAPAWEKWSHQLVTPRTRLYLHLMQAARVQKGQFILDMATGFGEPALTIAKHLSSVRIAGCDISLDMLEVAKRRFTSGHQSGFEAVHLTTRRLPFDDQVFDAAVCCFGLENFDDAQFTLTEIHRTVKSSSYVSFATWGPAADNPFHSAVSQVVQKYQPSDQNSIYGFSDPTHIIAEISRSGFQDIKVESCEGSYPFTSAEELWAFKADNSPLIQNIANSLNPSQQEDLLQELKRVCIPYQTTSGLSLPFKAWVTSARR